VPCPAAAAKPAPSPATGRRRPVPRRRPGGCVLWSRPSPGATSPAPRRSRTRRPARMCCSRGEDRAGASSAAPPLPPGGSCRPGRAARWRRPRGTSGDRLVSDLGFARERGSGLRPWLRTRRRREGSEGGAGGRLCEGERETVRYLVLCKEREKRGIHVVRERETTRCKKIDKREKRGTGGRGRSTVVCHAHGLEGAFYFCNPCLHMAGAQLF
jgi:hypothetical protein